MTITVNEIANEEALYSPADVARLFGVSRQAVHRWIKLGRLKATKLSARCIRIRQSDINRFLEESN